MTKGEIDRLGQRIGTSVEISSEDLDKLQEYRQTFQEPISRVFNYVLEAARKIDKQSIVTYRIKRIDTIIEKLRRFKDNENGSMNLSRMWDIAGCRCILNTTTDEKLFKFLKVIQKEYGMGCKVNDHITKPKDSGYRSIHIYVKDKLTQKPVEIQIRNRVQHNWATLVEIVDLLYGTKNKERGAVSRLGRFLYLYSKAKDLTKDEFSEMLKTERKMKVFERMSDVLTKNYLNIRRQWLKQKQKGSYFVITANRRSSEIISYSSFNEAEMAYYEKYQSNRDSNIVLTHIKMPDFEQISMAYSNYVLAMHAFFDDYRILVSNKIVEFLYNGEYFKFIRYFRIYTNNVKCHFRNLSMEVNGIESCKFDPEISRNQINKWRKEIVDRLQLWDRETRVFLRKIGMLSRSSSLKKWIVKNRVKQLAKAITEGQKG
ncbi:MAG: RelA/SpoT domain-containing protein [Bacteroidaceae bacterium]|nr:RelA/SpoT domain-containing protein [Bacteroidaceae bacterium]